MQFQEKLNLAKSLAALAFTFCQSLQKVTKKACRVKLAYRLKQVDAAASRFQIVLLLKKSIVFGKDSCVSAILAESPEANP